MRLVYDNNPRLIPRNHTKLRKYLFIQAFRIVVSNELYAFECGLVVEFLFGYFKVKPESLSI